MIKNLSHISLTTNSLKKVHNFYVKLLGLKVVHKFINHKGDLYGYFLSSGKNTYLEFFKSNKIEKFEKNRPFRHICFEVSSLLNIAKKFNNKKIDIKRGKTDGILQFFVNDGEGNIVEFHQRNKKE